jgi:hypothetical protein
MINFVSLTESEVASVVLTCPHEVSGVQPSEHGPIQALLRVRRLYFS